jgi:hydroxypyruvate isomerase
LTDQRPTTDRIERIVERTLDRERKNWLADNWKTIAAFLTTAGVLGPGQFLGVTLPKVEEQKQVSVQAAQEYTSVLNQQVHYIGFLTKRIQELEREVSSCNQ